MRTALRALASLQTLALACAALGLGACSIEGTQPEEKPPFEVEPVVPRPAPEVVPTERRVVLLHTNDEHSYLLGFAPVSEYPFVPEADGTVNVGAIAGKIGRDQQTVGGVVRRQYLINKLRDEAKDPVLLLSAGDVMMGTIMHVATAQAAPDYMAMAMLGYDFATIGNHEFDFGPDTLSTSIRTAQTNLFGAAVPLLASNIHFDDVKPGGAGSALKALYGEGNTGAAIAPWATKTLANGLKVGLVGLLGYDAALVAPSKSPIAFSVPDGAACSAAAACEGGLSCVRSRCVNPLDAQGHVMAAVADVQKHVNHLREVEKVDLVVALSHSGKVEDLALATYSTGIDVIIGGHSHDMVEPLVVGKTIIVQAGSYGRLLGQLTIAVSPEGEVSHLPAKSMLHNVDHTLDPEIYAGTDLTANPPVLSVPFERALKLTGAVVGPVAAGLNNLLGKQVLGIDDLFVGIVSSGHDIVGGVKFKDSNLMQMVTDAERLVVSGEACLDPAAGPVVAVQANGVIRESLRFGQTDGKATVADVFSVLPLGASPWAQPQVQLPGYPVTLFRLSAMELLVGADIGVTKGLEANSFFLSYSGMRISYRRDFPAFSQEQLATTGPVGRVTKIDLGSDAAGWQTVYEYTEGVAFPARWSNGVNPNTLITVVSNLYLTGFLDAFGMKPRAATGAPISLYQTVLCQTMQQLNCAGGVPAAKLCVELAGSTLPPDPISWPYPEVKEWTTLFKFLMGPLGGSIPAGLYAGPEPLSPRVIDVTPAP